MMAMVRLVRGRITILLLVLLAVVTEAKAQCEVSTINIYNVDQRTSSFYRNVTLKNNESCTDEDYWRAEVIPCEGGDPRHFCSTLRIADGGRCTMNKKGRWKLQLQDDRSVVSDCFEVLGTIVIPSIARQEFKVNGLQFDFAEPKDIRIKNWNLSIYKARNGGTPSCEMKSKFKMFFKTSEIGDNSILKLRHKFDLDGCYCFHLIANGYARLISTTSWFTFTGCNPKPEDRSIDEPPESVDLWLIIIAVVGAVVGVVGAITWLLYQVFKHRRRRIRTTILLDPEKIDYDDKQSTGLNHFRKVMFLHTADVVNHHQLSHLMHTLQQAWQVYDLYNYMDPKRMEDGNEWVQEMIQGEEGTKVILVLSPQMVSLISTLLNPDVAPSLGDGEDRQSSQLIFALRMIINTALIRDYSRMFVVKFADSLDEDTHNVSLLMESRRYKLPDHHDQLMMDIQASTPSKLQGQ